MQRRGVGRVAGGGAGRRTGRAVAAALCVLLTLALAGPTAADDRTSQPSAGATAPADEQQRQLDKILEQLRHDLAESSEATLAAAADLRLAEAALPGARQAVTDAQRLLATAYRQEAEAAARRGQAQTRLMLATLDAEQAAAMVAEQRSRIGRIARQAYQSGGAMSELSMLLESRSPADFAERLVTLQSVVTAQRSALEQLTSVQTEYGVHTADLEQIRDELAQAHERAQQQLAVVAQLEERARTAEQEVTRLVEARNEAMARARAAAAEDAATVARLHGVSSNLQARLAQEAVKVLGAAGRVDGATVPPRPGTLARPVSGPVTSPFGMRVHPITGVHKLHTGVDLGAGCGTPIRVARAGTVIESGYNTAYGYRTVVLHGAVRGVLLTTTYNHQQGLRVDEGQRVTAGEAIGIVGSTGYSTGCHLHFELIVNSAIVDPVPWMAAA